MVTFPPLLHFPVRLSPLFFFTFFSIFWTSNCTILAPANWILHYYSYCTIGLNTTIEIHQFSWFWWRSTGVFGVGGDLSWHPTPTVVLSSLEMPYRTFLLVEFSVRTYCRTIYRAFLCQESLEIWSLSLAVRSRSFYRRTGAEGDIRKREKEWRS